MVPASLPRQWRWATKAPRNSAANMRAASCATITGHGTRRKRLPRNPAIVRDRPCAPSFSSNTILEDTGSVALIKTWTGVPCYGPVRLPGTGRWCRRLPDHHAVLYWARHLVVGLAGEGGRELRHIGWRGNGAQRVRCMQVAHQLDQRCLLTHLPAPEACESQEEALLRSIAINADGALGMRAQVRLQCIVSDIQPAQIGDVFRPG